MFTCDSIRRPTAKIEPPDAPVSEYLKARERLGIERTVVVQPTTPTQAQRVSAAARSATPGTP